MKEHSFGDSLINSYATLEYKRINITMWYQTSAYLQKESLQCSLRLIFPLDLHWMPCFLHLWIYYRRFLWLRAKQRKEALLQEQLQASSLPPMSTFYSFLPITQPFWVCSNLSCGSLDTIEGKGPTCLLRAWSLNPIKVECFSPLRIHEMFELLHVRSLQIWPLLRRDKKWSYWILPPSQAPASEVRYLLVFILHLIFTYQL